MGEGGGGEEKEKADRALLSPRILEIACSGLYTKCNPIIINHVVRRSLTVAGRECTFSYFLLMRVLIL